VARCARLEGQQTAWVLPSLDIDRGSARGLVSRIFAESESPLDYCERGPGLTTALPKSEDWPDDTEARLESLAGVVRLQGAIIAELVQSNAELRQAAGLAPPKPTISGSTPWRSIKQVMHATGYSETQVRELIGQKRIAAEKVGGKWFIDTSAPMPHKRDNAA
jgi:hypothetical protein